MHKQQLKFKNLSQDNMIKKNRRYSITKTSLIPEEAQIHCEQNNVQK